MTEIKINEIQFNQLERLRYDSHKKYKYVKNIIGDKYDVNEDTYFFVYKDSHNFYLVFEGEKVKKGKISVSVIDEKLKEM